MLSSFLVPISPFNFCMDTRNFVAPLLLFLCDKTPSLLRLLLLFLCSYTLSLLFSGFLYLCSSTLSLFQNLEFLFLPSTNLTFNLRFSLSLSTLLSFSFFIIQAFRLSLGSSLVFLANQPRSVENGLTKRSVLGPCDGFFVGGVDNG